MNAAFVVNRTNSVMIVDVVEEDDERLSVGMKISEGGGADFHVQRSSLEHVPHRKSSGEAEAGAAVVYNTISANVFGCNFIHTAAGKKS